MTPKLVVLGLVLGLGVVACGPIGGDSPRPEPSPTSAPSIALPTQAATATAPPIPSPAATASAPAPTPTPIASASGAACLSAPRTGVIPSDRLTLMQVLGAPGSDVVQFELGEPSLEPAGQATASIEVARPPFTRASSGQSIDVQGEHVLEVVFKGMSIQNDAGQPTFTGDREFKTADPSRSLRHVVMFDESEGQVGWYVGYDGPDCVTVDMSGSHLELAIAFGPGS